MRCSQYRAISTYVRTCVWELFSFDPKWFIYVECFFTAVKWSGGNVGCTEMVSVNRKTEMQAPRTPRRKQCHDEWQFQRWAVLACVCVRWWEMKINKKCSQLKKAEQNWANECDPKPSNETNWVRRTIGKAFGSIYRTKKTTTTGVSRIYVKIDQRLDRWV